ncbi:MAG: anion permease [Phycisphaeraceae bacterium]|nr:anion permease [Phycisphaeraceae bacterium]
MRKIHQTIGLILGLVAFAACAIFWRDAAHPTMGSMAGIAMLMAVWWISEAAPLPVTALLPIALFPCLRIMNANMAAALFFYSTGTMSYAKSGPDWDASARQRCVS